MGRLQPAAAAWRRCQRLPICCAGALSREPGKRTSTPGPKVHDSAPFEGLIDAVPPVAGKPGRPRRRPGKLHVELARYFAEIFDHDWANLASDSIDIVPGGFELAEADAAVPAGLVRVSIEEMLETL
jgi:hypothetical protein